MKDGWRAQDACRKGWLRASPTGPVSTAAVLAVAADIARAMVALHGAGIVHGDLSGGALPLWGDAGLRQRQLANLIVPDPTLRAQATCCWRRTQSMGPAAAWLEFKCKTQNLCHAARAGNVQATCC